MDMGHVILAAMQASNDESSIIDNQLKRMDFHLAEEMNWETFEKVDAEAKKLQALYKVYIMGVVQEDKNKRLESMQAIKEALTRLPKNLHSFRKFWKEHNNCETESCKNHK